MSYITLKNGGMDFRTISYIMKKLGYDFNHATTRNYLLQTMEDLIVHLNKDLQLDLSKEEIKNLKSNQRFYDLIEDVIYKAHEQNKGEQK